MPAARHYTTYTKEEVRNSTAIIANQKNMINLSSDKIEKLFENVVRQRN